MKKTLSAAVAAIGLALAAPASGVAVGGVAMVMAPTQASAYTVGGGSSQRAFTRQEGRRSQGAVPGDCRAVLRGRKGLTAAGRLAAQREAMMAGKCSVVR